MAAKSKSELIETTRAEFGKLANALKSIDSRLAMAKDAEDTSIKDIVAHRAHWIDLFLGWFSDGVAGKPVHIPAKGYKWNQLKQYNSELRKTQIGLGWRDSLERLNGNHKKLLGFMEGHSEEDLYGGPMQGANSKWTAGRFAEAAGPSHYRSANKYIRSRLRDLSG